MFDSSSKHRPASLLTTGSAKRAVKRKRSDVFEQTQDTSDEQSAISEESNASSAPVYSADTQANWHPPMAQPYYSANDAGAENRPLLDASLLVNEVWKWRWPILGTTILGGLLGAVIAISTPQKYTSYTSLMLDPREIKLVERDLTPEFLPNEGALAIIDSRLTLATSTPVLKRVIERTNLTQDPEFNGEGTGAAGGLSIITGLLSGSDSKQNREQTTLENLRKAVVADRSTRTFIINIGATTKNREKSALIANELAATFIEEQSGLRSDKAREASVALSQRLGTLRGAVETAEQRVEEFRAANNLVNAQGRLITDDEILAVSAALTKARGATSEARAKADAARNARLDTVVAGALPTTLVTPSLTTFRAQYASLKQQLASVELQLGPRHPRLENIRAATQSAVNDINAELARIVAGTQADLRSAIQNEQQLGQQLAQVKAQTSNNSDALVQLRELEREASAARDTYEAALRRSRETGEMEAVNTNNARIISEAEPPVHASSLSRKLLAIGSAMAGFALGLGLALASGVVKSLKASTAFTPGSGAPMAPAEPTHPNGPTGASRRKDPTKPANQPSSNQQPPVRESDMYPYAPYYPQPIGQAAYPGQQAMQPQSHYQPAPQPLMGMPMGYGYGAPFAGNTMMNGYPPAPMMPVGYPQQQQQQSFLPPQVQPIFMPIMQQPQAQAPTPAPVAAAVPPQNQSPTERDAREINELRQSVRDLRDMVDHLSGRRYG